MKLRLASDLHMEICPYFVPPMVGDEDTVLLLPGDICVRHYLGQMVQEFFENVSARFKAVIYVPGNHEYYKGHLEHDDPKLREWFTEKEFTNVHFLNTDSIVIDDVAFVGATLWTDVNRGDPMSKMAIEAGLNDYRHIRTAGYRKIRANDTIVKHIVHKNYIFEQVANYRTIGVRKVVVLSHHAPSELSVHAKYKGDVLNAAYFSNMEYQIMDSAADIWVHGHTHNSFQYTLGATQVICNPRGYSNLMRRSEYEAIPLMPAYDPENPDHTAIKDKFARIFHTENETFDPYFRFEI